MTIISQIIIPPPPYHVGDCAKPCISLCTHLYIAPELKKTGIMFRLVCCKRERCIKMFLFPPDVQHWRFRGFSLDTSIKILKNTRFHFCCCWYFEQKRSYLTGSTSGAGGGGSQHQSPSQKPGTIDPIFIIFEKNNRANSKNFLSLHLVEHVCSPLPFPRPPHQLQVAQIARAHALCVVHGLVEMREGEERQGRMGHNVVLHTSAARPQT